MISVRPAAIGDHPRLAEIFLKGRRQAFSSSDPSIFHLSDFNVQTEGEVIYVASDEDDMPVGFISVWEEESFIHHLYVDSNYQRQGVGAMLIESLRRWLPFPHSLKCVLDNAPARSFYLKAGWKDVSTGDDPLGRYALMVSPIPSR